VPFTFNSHRYFTAHDAELEHVRYYDPKNDAKYDKMADGGISVVHIEMKKPEPPKNALPFLRTPPGKGNGGGGSGGGGGGKTPSPADQPSPPVAPSPANADVELSTWEEPELEMKPPGKKSLVGGGGSGFLAAIQSVKDLAQASTKQLIQTTKKTHKVGRRTFTPPDP
jgi:hypothetical protein